MVTPRLLSLLALLGVAACDTPQSYYAVTNTGLVEITERQALEGQGRAVLANNPPLQRAVDRNPTAADVAGLRQRDPSTLTPDEVADLSIVTAREICNIPDGQPITPSTPCNFQ